MNEKKLMKISFAGSALGIIILYILVLNFSYDTVSVGNIDNSFANKIIKVSGKVSEFKSGKTTSFILNDGDSIKVVFWEDTLEQLELSGFDLSKLKNGAEVEITGNVVLYKGDIELVPLRSQIRIVSVLE